MNAEKILESVDAYVKAIKNAQILMFPGGFSAETSPTVQASS